MQVDFCLSLDHEQGSEEESGDTGDSGEVGLLPWGSQSILGWRRLRKTHCKSLVECGVLSVKLLHANRFVKHTLRAEICQKTHRSMQERARIDNHTLAHLSRRVNAWCSNNVSLNVRLKPSNGVLGS